MEATILRTIPDRNGYNGDAVLCNCVSGGSIAEKSGDGCTDSLSGEEHPGVDPSSIGGPLGGTP